MPAPRASADHLMTPSRGAGWIPAVAKPMPPGTPCRSETDPVPELSARRARPSLGMTGLDHRFPAAASGRVCHEVRATGCRDRKARTRQDCRESPREGACAHRAAAASGAPTPGPQDGRPEGHALRSPSEPRSGRSDGCAARRVRCRRAGSAGVEGVAPAVHCLGHFHPTPAFAALRFAFAGVAPGHCAYPCRAAPDPGAHEVELSPSDPRTFVPPSALTGERRWRRRTNCPFRGVMSKAFRTLSVCVRFSRFFPMKGSLRPLRRVGAAWCARRSARIVPGTGCPGRNGCLQVPVRQADGKDDPNDIETTARVTAATSPGRRSARPGRSTRRTSTSGDRT